MKILSLFDGISCARVALERAEIPVEIYYASEIDKYAIEVSKKNYPDVRHIGDVKDISETTISLQGFIDLLIGGSPCQDLSIAGKRKGLNGERSGLFYEYVRILKEVKPKYFILENVASMSKEARQTITDELFGIEPVMINASLVSAQNRKRLFWVGKLDEFGTYQKVEIPQPEDKGILLKDILEENVDEKYFVNISEKYKYKGLVDTNDKAKTMSATMYKGYGNDGVTTIRIGQLNSGGQADRIYSPKGKSTSLSANGGGRGAKTGLYCVGIIPENIKPKGNYLPRERVFSDIGKSRAISTSQSQMPFYEQNYKIRKLTPIECERLQGLPDNYTFGVSNSQRYKQLGNGFNVDVVAHIIKNLN